MALCVVQHNDTQHNDTQF